MIETETKAPIGTGGWMNIPLFFLYLSPFLTLLIYFYGLANENSTNNLLSFEITKILTDFIFPFLLIYFVTKRSKHFPKLMIAWYIIGTAAGFIFELEYYFSMSDKDYSLFEDRYNKVLIWLCYVSIWIPYFIYSKRVKNTFIN